MSSSVTSGSPVIIPEESVYEVWEDEDWEETYLRMGFRGNLAAGETISDTPIARSEESEASEEARLGFDGIRYYPSVKAIEVKGLDSPDIQSRGADFVDCSGCWCWWG